MSIEIPQMPKKQTATSDLPKSEESMDIQKQPSSHESQYREHEVDEMLQKFNFRQQVSRLTKMDRNDFMLNATALRRINPNDEQLMDQPVSRWDEAVNKLEERGPRTSSAYDCESIFRLMTVFPEKCTRQFIDEHVNWERIVEFYNEHLKDTSATEFARIDYLWQVLAIAPDHVKKELALNEDQWRQIQDVIDKDAGGIHLITQLHKLHTIKQASPHNLPDIVVSSKQWEKLKMELTAMITKGSKPVFIEFLVDGMKHVVVRN